MAHNLVSECPSDGAETEIAACDLLLFALPEGHGLELWKEIHGDQTLTDLPAAILTVQNQEIVRILDWSKGHDCLGNDGQVGAAAQLKKLLQIAQSSDPLNAPLETGQFVIDPFSYRVTHAGKQSTLSVLEFRLLYYLATRPNRFFTRNQLHAVIWRGSRSVNPRVVDVYIRRLRLRIESDPGHPVHLKTLRGMGYLFDSAPRTSAVERDFS
jgi:DNA-binding response OmpR family regulator